jgi:hypothetical protein
MGRWATPLDGGFQRSDATYYRQPSPRREGGRMATSPHTPSRLENQLWNGFWVLVSLAVPSLAAFVGSRQQVLLKQLDHAKIHLSGFDEFLVWLPGYVPWLAFVAFAVLATVLMFRRRTPEPKPRLRPLDDSESQAETQNINNTLQADLKVERSRNLSLTSRLMANESEREKLVTRVRELENPPKPEPLLREQLLKLTRDYSSILMRGATSTYANQRQLTLTWTNWLNRATAAKKLIDTYKLSPDDEWKPAQTKEFVSQLKRVATSLRGDEPGYDEPPEQKELPES